MKCHIAAAQGLALYTTNPRDYEVLDEYVQVIPVRRPNEYIQEAARQSVLVAQADQDGDAQEFIEAVSMLSED